LATNPEGTEDREQTFVRRVVEVLTSPATSKKSRDRIVLPLAAAFGSLAPDPIGALTAALIVYAALDSR
jgi:hypothetical protein